MDDNTTTTFRAAFLDLLTYLEQLIGISGNESNVTIRKVLEGENIIGSAPLAHINLRFQTIKSVGRADRNKVWEVQLGIQVRSEIRSARGGHTEILSKVALIQDKLDAYVRPSGVQGLDNSVWSISFPSSATQGNEVHADSILTMTVVVAPNQN